MRILYFLFFVSVLLSVLNSCKTTLPNKTKATPISKAQQIVDQAIQKHGAHLLSHSIVEFDFRGKAFKASLKGSAYQFERSFSDKSGKQIKDVLNNEEFYREENGQKISLTDKQKAGWSGSVNSVHYFVQLPLRLNDPAVIKKFVGEAMIKGEKYDKVEVRFKEEGGGRDHEDVYLYWFNQNTHTMDYLAYNFLVNGGGARFREAYNVRIVDGIRFADYINYKPKTDNRNVTEFDQLFEQDGLEELSRIDTENIRVRFE